MFIYYAFYIVEKFGICIFDEFLLVAVYHSVDYFVGYPKINPIKFKN